MWKKPLLLVSEPPRLLLCIHWGLHAEFCRLELNATAAAAAAALPSLPELICQLGTAAAAFTLVSVSPLPGSRARRAAAAAVKAIGEEEEEGD